MYFHTVSKHDKLRILNMYIYHVLISALSTHMLHINLNTIFCVHVEQSPTNSNYVKYYLKQQQQR